VPASWDEAVAALDTTIGYWRDWLSTAKLPDHPWRPYLARSALTLKGLSCAPSGAIMAASTTSLPETRGGARNWDYRYTWIRDSAFMLRSLYRLGFRCEAIDYFGFIIDALSQRRPQ
jgi:GH15 family glucan-1,4-alpha-glucosidase